MPNSPTLAARLQEYIAACFTGLWIVSHEQEDALTDIAQMCREHSWRLAVWDLDRGLHTAGDAPAADTGPDPVAALKALPAMATPDSSAILVLANFHRFLNSAEVVQALVRQIVEGKQHRTFVVILSPVVQIPPELEKLFVVIEQDLPDRAQLEAIARGIATEEGELPEAQALSAVLDAAAGLTRYEAEGAFSLSLVRHARLAPESLWELKSGLLKKSGLMQLYKGGERFAGLGGLAGLKAFCLRSLSRAHATDPHRRPRGVLLLGVPGSGKSAFAKALGAEVGRPTLILDIGALMGSLVGSTEANIRQALKIADAMAPCIVMVDELEKALAGAASSGQTDSGVTARLFGTFLTWLNDRTSDCYVICTCNNISRLPPEFSRAERFDGVWFLDLPDRAQKDAIWGLHRKFFGIDPAEKRPIDDGWTGAEIRACCRLAAVLDVPLSAAAEHVVPISATAQESVSALRQWATGRCLDSERGGIYRATTASSNSARRRVDRDASLN